MCRDINQQAPYRELGSVYQGHRQDILSKRDGRGRSGGGGGGKREVEGEAEAGSIKIYRETMHLATKD